jgi:hypothetical protein
MLKSVQRADAIVSTMGTAAIAVASDAGQGRVDVSTVPCASISSEDFARLAHPASTAAIVHRVNRRASSLGSQSTLRLVICPGVKNGYCFNGGICSGGTTCLCGLRSEWSGVDCSERRLRHASAPHFRLLFRICLGRCSGNYTCLNNGMCTSSAKHVCVCPSPFTGPYCADRL